MRQRIARFVANFHISLSVDLTDWVVGVGWVWDAYYFTVNVNLHVLCLTLRIAWWPHESRLATDDMEFFIIPTTPYPTADELKALFTSKD